MDGSRKADSEGREVLEGTVRRIVFSSEETGFAVVRLDLSRPPWEATAVGGLLNLGEGERAILTGRWVQDPKFGSQFKVESYSVVLPETIDGIERYLGSGMVRGIGPVIARRIVKKFGLDTFKIIDDEPERLKEVEGVGSRKAGSIASAWTEHRDVRDTMVFLQGHGVSMVYALKIIKAYGKAAAETVRRNPYRLAEDIHGIGFKKADAIASKMGFPLNSPLRAEAGVVFTLMSLSEEGHVCCPREDLEEKAAEMLAVDRTLASEAVERLVFAGKLVIEPDLDRSLYLSSLHAAEVSASGKLAELLGCGPSGPPIDAEKALKWVEGRLVIKLSGEQAEAVKEAICRKMLIITGGPGTGKTTIVRAIAEIFAAKGLQVALMAPTGRAAKRLSEASGCDARTIHRALEYNPKFQRFTRDAGRPLSADVAVVDEASMVDIALCDSLLRALRPKARLVLVGDVDQLPSVGPGCVLADLIGCGAVPVRRLTEVFRQKAESLIITNAHRILKGDFPLTDPRPGRQSDFFFVERSEAPAVVDVIRELVSARIPARFSLDPLRDVQVLTPMHAGETGARNLNVVLQQALNPQGREHRIGERSLRVGDRVMQIKNNYDKDVFNGDVGRIAAIEAAEQRVTVEFDRRVNYNFSELDELILAYAVSIHKSQGSEYPAVVVPVTTQHFIMLRRNLIYTAITRGKRLVIVVGTKKALAIAIRNNKVEERHTGLAWRMRAAAARGG